MCLFIGVQATYTKPDAVVTSTCTLHNILVHTFSISFSSHSPDPINNFDFFSNILKNFVGNIVHSVEAALKFNSMTVAPPTSHSPPTSQPPSNSNTPVIAALVVVVVLLVLAVVMVIVLLLCYRAYQRHK